MIQGRFLDLGMLEGVGTTPSANTCQERDSGYGVDRGSCLNQAPFWLSKY